MIRRALIAIAVVSIGCLAIALLIAGPFRSGGDRDRPPGAASVAPPGATDLYGARSEQPTSRYQVEYPAIDYEGAALTGRLARLDSELADGSLATNRTGARARLLSVLAALDIDASSQLLVFSKTSLQVAGVLPDTPRAIYFNEDTYVAYVPGEELIEIASMDPVLGPVLHTFDTRAADSEALAREPTRCLRCHDSYSLTGGGVPRFLLGSGYIGTRGEIVSHEAWILMRPWTPLRSRWGGWYVTGYHGEQVHLGNMVVESIESLQNLESLRIGNLETLEGLLDTSRYLTAYSDIVALLVIQLQTDVQNALTRARWDLISALAEMHADLPPDDALAALPEAEREALLDRHFDDLVTALLFADQVELTAPVSGTSGFAEWFEGRGVTDAAGRSLHALDLETRVLRYPLSYEIYSEAFDALPAAARRYVYRRVRQELGTATGSLDMSFVAEADRRAALEILGATKPEFAATVN